MKNRVLALNVKFSEIGVCILFFITFAQKKPPFLRVVLC